MAEAKTFYKTVITYVVLSESPVTSEDLASLLLECDGGSDVGYERSRNCSSISKEEMNAELARAGSDPSFFQTEAEEEPGLLNNLAVGDEVFWRDPDDNLCSGYGILSEIKTDSGVVEGEDTVLVLQMKRGGIAEVFVGECC